MREAEGRIYSDEQLLKLPSIEPQHHLYIEWKLREESAKRLRNYLHKFKNSLKILEVGCGNGWLSNYLSCIPNAIITGYDINRYELSQAKRIFEKPGKIEFVNEIPPGKRFDQVIFAASIQYFPSISKTIHEYLGMLNPGGEIHILDTHFYGENEIISARERSAEYFNQHGFAGFSSLYFHHTMKELDRYDFQILYRPSLINKILKNYHNPFPWISIRNR